MTTHLRARVVQAGALLALVGGLLAVAPAAAVAVQPNVTIDSLSTDIPSGGSTNLQYTITNKNLAGGTESTSVQVTVTGLSCTGQCGAVVTINSQQSVTRNAKLTAPQVGAGETKTVTLTITATIGSDKVTATQPINVQGPDKPKSVRQISGRVKDSNGKPIAGATVGARDSTNKNFGAVTNADGGYAITSTEDNPIAVGQITVGAAKEGYQTKTVTVQGAADKSINVPLTLPLIAASASASPSASASASAEPSEEATDEATDATEQPSAAAADTKNTSGDDSGSSSLLFIILGGLLVAAGIGAIVLVVMRRKDSGADGDSDGPGGPDGPTGAGSGGVVPASQGRFNGTDATRVGAPVGVGANDATMVTSLAPQSSISDAPTMLQRAVPVEDEFPDPYGAPAPAAGNYAGPGGWGTAPGAAAGAGTYGGGQQGGTYGGSQYGGPPAPAQAGGYDDGGYGANQYGRPQNEDAYGAYGAGQYGGAAEQQRFDEPTGMYRPEPQGGAAEQQRFDEPTGMYRPEPQGGYDQAGYDQGGYDQGGYDQGGAQQGYGQQGYDQGGYHGGQESGSYGPAGGEYHQEPEYPPAGRGGGYQSGGYQGGGYGGAPGPAGDQGGYGSWNSPGSGIDSGNGYGPPAGGGYDDQRGAYGAPAGGGYGDQGGYDQRGGYGQPDGGYEQGGGRRQQGAYGPDQGEGGHYGGGQEGGGRHGGQSRQQPPESTHPGQRRSLDWLDD